MPRFANENRRPSTIRRDNQVHQIYNEIAARLGETANYISRSYIYNEIHQRTGLCVKTIAFILNHTPT